MTSPADLARPDLDQARAAYDALVAQGMKLDLTRGKPSAAQLDLAAELLHLPADRFKAADGTDTRNYGGLQGLPELREIFAPVLQVPAEQLIAFGNGSLELMHDTLVNALLNAMPGSPRRWVEEERVVFLAPVPGYDRHFGVCERLGIELVPVPLTDYGPDMDEVERLVAADPAIKGIWCVPKYANPSGSVYSSEVVDRLARMKTAAPDFRVFWDNAYAVHHLTEERIEIPSLLAACAAHGNPHRAFVFGSTSKITLAGAGVALFAGSAENVAWYLGRMGKRTIGGDKVNQLRHVRALKDTEGLLALMDRHRAIVAPKFAAVADAFEQHLGGTGVAEWTAPKGGYFISLDVMDGCAKELVRLSKEAGVELTPAGSTHPLGKDPRDRNVRIAPTFPDLATVKTAAEGVAVSVLLATSTALLAKATAK